MKKKTVLPGEFLSTEEEFEAGKNAFPDNGEILAAAIGEVVEDSKQKTVSVQGQKNVSSIRPGDLVLGVVQTVRDNSVTLSIIPQPIEGGRKILAHTRASLPVRMVSRDYVERLKDEFKIGDFVRAKVAKVEVAGIDLRTDEPDLGVIKAFCSRCREPLHLFESQLKCLSCGSNEKRKISQDYTLK